MSAVLHAAVRRRSPAARPRPADPCVRRAQSSDYPAIARQVDTWSRGRFMAAALPRSFFDHFADTSLLLHHAGALAGVLVGFRSQTRPAVAYVHFVAIAPGSRRAGFGRRLYEDFFLLAAMRGCEEVQSIASPVNSSLIAFHRQLGFEVVDGGGFSCGIAVCPDFAGPGQPRVLFRRPLGDPPPAGA